MENENILCDMQLYNRAFLNPSRSTFVFDKNK